MLPVNVPWVTKIVIFVLLAYLGLAMFLKAIVPTYTLDADYKQTLFLLVTAVVFFLIGKNSDSSKKDDQMSALALASAPTPSAIVPNGTPVDPISTKEVKP